MIKRKSIIYIDMDDVLCDFTGAHKKAIKCNPKVLYPQSQYGFFANLEPIPNAIESVIFLINSEHFDPYILTAPSIKNPLCYTEKRIWIEKHFGLEFVNKLIISPNKCLLKGRYLIDDNAQGKGQDAFEGELIHFGSETFPSWREVNQYLNSHIQP
ncbi:hypothetical protein DN730_11020 [Marinomonas piezotolerans]|uniref:Uncharacterized protein n=1 Tax=Marinomonas piezotolerans TaxID=2213058 RepID=A0A370U8N5_9GAMM|nr:hypothetical protein [Marinomonas piezotolerans]RDL44156.1 hypothetical protein DN730_11020 [Marinomonas piezotolerans]